MADPAVDPFANGANPFSGPAPDAGSADPFANGNNPFAGPVAHNDNAAPTITSPHPGALANAPGDTTATEIGKGTATAAIKGAGDIPGIFGNLSNLGEMASQRIMAGIQTGIGKLTGSDATFADNLKKNQDALDKMHAEMRASGAPVVSDYVPTGETFSNPVLAKTGEYVPTTLPGRIGMAGVETAVGSVVPGAGVGETITNAAKTAVPNFIAGGVGQGVTEATGDPLLGAAAGAGAAHGAHVTGEVVQHGVSAVSDALPAVTEAQRVQAARRQVGGEMNAAATNPTAAAAALETAPREIVPGSQGTVGPMSGDTGLIAYEKAASQSPEGIAAYSERMAQQNAARQNAIASVQPQGAVTDLPEAVRTNAAAADAATQQAVEAAKTRAAANEQLVDQATQAHVEGAQQAQASALANIQALRPDASPLETAQHFRAMRDALEQQGAQETTTAQNAASQARSASAPVAQNPEQVGAALRAPAQAGRDTASAATETLYQALPKDMVAPTADIAAKAKAIQAAQLPEHSPISGEEARLYGLAQGYGDAMPLANVNALRGSILSARSTLKQSDPQAYGRLGQLQGVVEGAVDHAVENRAALDAIAVRRGNMAASDALPARISKVQQAENEWRKATQQPTALAAGGGLAGQTAGRSEAVVSRGNGEASPGSRGPRNAEGVSGVSEASGGATSGAGVGTSAPLRQANAAYREMKQTFDEGPVGDILAKTGRGEPRQSNADVAANFLHGRPSEGEDVRAYLKAAGPKGAAAMSDAAAYSLHEAATRPDGTFDAAKATKWIDDHKLALAELPTDVRGKFENAATAQQAVSDALAKQRDNIASFDKSEAGKVAGFGHEGDVVKHVGSIIDSKSAPEQRLAELATAAKSNPAAQNGLKRAVIEHVLDKFVPEGADPKTEAMQAYVNAKEPVLSKVLSPDEIKAVTERAAAATAAQTGVEAAQAGRAEALKGVQQAGKEAVQGAAQARTEALSKYERGVLGQLRGVNTEGDVLNVIKGVLNAKDGAAKMQALSQEAAKVPGATDALKKAVTEVIKRDFSSTTEAGVSGQMELKRAGLKTFMDTKTDALKAVGLSDQQIGLLRAVTADGLQANRTISAVKSKGGSDTLANQAMGSKLARDSRGSMLSHMAVDAGLAGVGHMFGGVPGLLIGKYIGDKVMGAMRESGMNRVKQLRVEAVLNPDLGLALMKEAPKAPNRDAAALLGLRLRQLSMAGILAGQPAGASR